ncbi:hypothetical protein CDAR_377081 [Caerostris darwini]|uniref:Uncharacterized protein n=1 Tax=Caerostris darwini TaxID=1538125 RepID=A0AAV4PSN8_9ARAC|nr:hypothetical protein CDAR_377081 [Caerostris darwini]
MFTKICTPLCGQFPVHIKHTNKKKILCTQILFLMKCALNCLVLTEEFSFPEIFSGIVDRPDKIFLVFSLNSYGAQSDRNRMISFAGTWKIWNESVERGST